MGIFLLVAEPKHLDKFRESEGDLECFRVGFVLFVVNLFNLYYAGY